MLKVLHFPFLTQHANMLNSVKKCSESILHPGKTDLRIFVEYLCTFAHTVEWYTIMSFRDVNSKCFWPVVTIVYTVYIQIKFSNVLLNITCYKIVRQATVSVTLSVSPVCVLLFMSRGVAVCAIERACAWVIVSESRVRVHAHSALRGGQFRKL